jgi:hypothetical protein
MTYQFDLVILGSGSTAFTAALRRESVAGMTPFRWTWFHGRVQPTRPTE